MRPETREKIAWEHRGTNLSAEEYLPKKQESESLTNIEIAAMEEEIRNEVAKTCVRELSFQEQADAIMAAFARFCEGYIDGKYTHADMLLRYDAALKAIHELR